MECFFEEVIGKKEYYKCYLYFFISSAFFTYESRRMRRKNKKERVYKGA